MADENEKASEVSPNEVVGARQRPTLFIILAIVNMLVLGGVAVMLYTEKMKDESKSQLDKVIKGENETKEKEDADQKYIGKVIPLETFLVNLAGSRGRKLAKVNIELELNNEEVQIEIDQLKPKIRDIIITILSSKSYAQVSVRDGKDILREEVKNKVNLFLTKGKIKKVYFTEFIYN